MLLIFYLLCSNMKIYVVEAHNIFNEADRTQLFSNLEEILITNDNFFQDLQACIQSHIWN